DEFFSAQWTYGGTPGESRAYLKFDLSQIPAGSILVSANLSFYADPNGNNGYYGQPTYGNNNASYLHLVTSAWNPTNVTWNTQPTSTNANEVLLAQSTNTAENYLNLNISSFVQTWLNNPASNYGMSLQMIGQNYYNSLIFCSSAYP